MKLSKDTLIEGKIINKGTEIIIEKYYPTKSDFKEAIYDMLFSPESRNDRVIKDIVQAHKMAEGKDIYNPEQYLGNKETPQLIDFLLRIAPGNYSYNQLFVEMYEMIMKEV